MKKKKEKKKKKKKKQTMVRRRALQVTSSSSGGEQESEATPPSTTRIPVQIASEMAADRAGTAAAAAEEVAIDDDGEASEAEDDDLQLLHATTNRVGRPPSSISSPPVASFSSLLQASSSSSSSSPHAPPQASLESMLHSRGVKASPEWLSHCVRRLSESVGMPVSSFLCLPLAEQAQRCFSAFLFADLNAMGAPSLPPRIHTLHATELAGPFVLQVDEIIDIGSAIRDRYKERPASISRCLKISMTDGIQRVFGLEYRPIKDLNVLSPAGFKIAIHHVNIRRGLLLLVPEVIIVLGGHVETLEAARQKVVQHVNKPPRGSRNVTGSRQSLAETASVVAWDTLQTEDTSHRSGDASRSSLHSEQTPQISRNLPSGHIASNLDGVLDSSILHNKYSARSELENSSLTYLSILKKSWSSDLSDAANMVGRVKCVLTGVKDFEYRNLNQFNLFVYVDDGSEICTVKIDHQIVERLIGFTPGEVSEALKSSRPEEVTMMKDNMIRFQTFLTRFEGILLVRKDGNSGFVAIEMSEGCSDADAWSLVERLQSTTDSSSVATSVAPIEVSP